ncbi:MAG: hypothetical protein AAF211_06605 [Myxococcota bacterium]
MASDPPAGGSLVEPRLVRHASDWERELWLLHDPRGGTVERGVLVVFSVALAGLLGRLAVLGRMSPEHFLVFGLVGLVMLGGIIASFTGRHLVVKVSRDGLSLDHLEGLVPDDADFDRVWDWSTSWSTGVPWQQIQEVVTEPDGRLRLRLTHGDWVLGTMRSRTLDSLVPAIRQGIRMWGAHRQRPDGAMADLQALRGQVSRETA